MREGADLGIRPHGLQALFALRLEKGHVIIGMDTELDTTPRRLGMDWAVNMEKPFFIGRDALARTLPNRRRVEFPGLDHGGSSDVGPANRNRKTEIVAPEIRSFFAGR